jgi:hypothetical protein
VLFCKELDFFDICLEKDSLQIARECTIDLANMSRYDHLLEGIKSGMKVFGAANLVYVKREVNSAAYGLLERLSPIL